MTARAVLVGLLAAVVLSGCTGLAFRDPGVVTITFPPDRATVALPVRIAWEAADLVDGQHYGVFVDRMPPPPGATVDETYEVEERQGIHVADDTEILLDQIAIRGGVPDRERDRHEVVVVILDADGRRVGEWAGFRDLRVAREARS